MSIPKSGAKVRASDWSAVFPVDTDAWQSYVPTVTQGVGVANTVNYARYFKNGRLCAFNIDLAVTGTGTAASNVIVSLPLTAASANLIVGSGIIYDASAAIVYAGVAHLNAVTTFGLWSASTDGSPSQFLGLRVFTAALASGDAIRVGGVFETAT